MKDRIAKQVLSGGRGVGTSGKRDSKQRVKEGEYGGCTLYTCMKTEQ
jgi:hypothetical protein